MRAKRWTSLVGALALIACDGPRGGPETALAPSFDRGGVPRQHTIVVNPNANGEAIAATIQEGINMVEPRGIVQVKPGTYAEALVINKGLTIEAIGDGSEPVIVDPPGAPGAAILVTGVEPVIIRDLTVHRRGVVGVEAAGGVDLTLERVTILAVQVPDATNSGVRLFNNSGLTGRRAHLLVRGSLIDGGGLPRSLGINLQADVDAVLDGNVIVRSGAQCIRVVSHQPGALNVEIVNNHLDECRPSLRFAVIDVGPVGPPLTPALPIGMTGVVNIVGNTIRNNGGSCFPTNAIRYELYTGRIERNSIVDFLQPCAQPTATALPAAIWVGSLRGFTAPSPVVRFNDIEGNAHAGLRVAPNIATSLDASCNWWGSASGPSGAGPGSGDAVAVEAGAATPIFAPFATAPIAGTRATGC